MKKISAIILCAAITFSLTACQTDKNDLENNSGSIHGSGQSNSDNSENIGEKLDGSTAKSGELKLIFEGDPSMTEIAPQFDHIYGNSTNNGIYMIKANLLTYIDYATKQEIVLCTDSSCKHDNEKCTAVLSYDEFYHGSPGLFVYNGYLYAFNSNYYDEGSFSLGASLINPRFNQYVETRKNSLYRMNLDGTNREKILELDGNSVMENFAVGDGESIWIFTKTPYSYTDDAGTTYNSSKNRALVKFDLTARQFTERIPLDDVDGVKRKFLGVYGKKFLFGYEDFPEGKSIDDMMEIMAAEIFDYDKYLELHNNSEFVICALDCADKSVSEIYRNKYSEVTGSCILNDNFIYIGANGKATIRLDLDSGTTEIYDPHKGYYLSDFFAGREVFRPSDPNDPALYFSDPQSGKLTKCEFIDSFDRALAACSDEIALIYCGWTGDERPIQPGTFENTYNLYAIISLDDLFNGRDNIEPVSLIKYPKN